MADRKTEKFDRRNFLKATAGSFIAWYTADVMADSTPSQSPRPRLVWIILRGGMDSLHAVFPHSDPHLTAYRKRLVKPLKNTAFNLGGGFALHPAFKTLNLLFKQGEFIPVVATESGDRSRSHFYAQDIMESGLPEVDVESGWLNRAVEAYRGESLAIAHTLPVGLRGKQLAKTWYPDVLKPAKEDLYERLQLLYGDDKLLSQRLDEGLKSRSLLGDMKKTRSRNNFASLAGSCGALLAGRKGPDCAMLEMSGWDTHQNQVAHLDRQFNELDQGIARLRENLADQWRQTVVIMTTEFGRTVAENGTEGTDHGTASAMFIAGGAVAGGRVLGQWPGLDRPNLFENRDLMPTSDNRQWIRAILSQHWKLNPTQLEYVFPTVSTMNSQLIRPLS